jgi:hypothetical protein
MKKFVVIYRVPVETMEEWKKNTSPEEMKAQGEKLGADMMAWTEKHKASFVGEGLPLGKNTRIDATGAKPITNDMNYMQVVEAESIEAVIEMFKDCPHIQIPASFLDIMEVSHMGM